ncbi:MAG: tetratricopeptide repeat protein [Ignavibacteria bacterium]
MLDSLKSIHYSEPNKALKLGFEILKMQEDELPDSIIAFTKVEIGFILDKQGFPAQALTFYLEAAELLSKIGLKPIAGYLYVDIGNLFFHHKQFDLAAEKYNEAIEIFKLRKNFSGIYTCINNFALIKRELKDFDNAKKLFYDALNIALTKTDIPYLIAHSYSYIGDLYKTMGKTDSAIASYDKAISIKITQKGHNLIGLNYQKTAAIFLEKGDTLTAIRNLKLAEKDFISDYNVYYLIKLYTRMFDLFFVQKEYHLAVKYLNSAYELTKKEELLKEQIDILKNFCKYYSLTNNQSKLIATQKGINALLEKRYESDVSANLIKFDILHIIDNYKKQLAIQNLTLKNTQFVRNTAIIASITLFVLLWLLFVQYQYKKKYHLQVIERNEEKHNNLIQIENLKREQANRELLAKTAAIEQQNNLLLNFKKQIENKTNKYNNGISKDLKKLSVSIDSILKNDTNWKQFTKQFVKVHPEFFKKLTTICKSLSINDLKICAYHKLNLDTKEIALLTALTVRSIQTSRYRLKKKLNIPQDTSFQEFINQL